MSSKTRCIDCSREGITKKRKVSQPGPRCSSHQRAKKNQSREAAKDRHIEKTYGISIEFYWSLYEYQGRRCYLCQRAKGTGRKRLAVDHDHACCSTTPTCGRCVRGLLCSPCNKTFGHLRDEAEAFRRGAIYLDDPPAQQLLRLT